MTSSKRIRLCKDLPKKEFSQNRSILFKPKRSEDKKNQCPNDEIVKSKPFLWIEKLFRLRTLNKEIKLQTNIKIIIIKEEEYNADDPNYYNKNADTLCVYKFKRNIFLI